MFCQANDQAQIIVEGKVVLKIVPAHSKLRHSVAYWTFTNQMLKALETKTRTNDCYFDGWLKYLG